MMAIIQTYSDPEALARAAALYFVDCAAAAISERGQFSVVLAGGSTPKATYQLLATVEFAHHINWEKVNVFWGDERMVPPDHEDSNYKMANNALLRYLPIPKAQIHRMPGEIDPKEAARVYELSLRNFFGDKPLHFDLVLLGLGEDGHTASLFPGTTGLRETQRWVIANYVRKLSSWRLTLSRTAINSAINVAFLVSGENKADALHRVLAGRYEPEMLPAQFIRPKGQLRWIVDTAASALL
jgi:6-phosphogluconolactonase